VKLRTLRALTEEGGVGWGRTGSWLGWLRAGLLLLHPDELEALLELDIVKGPLAEARGPASLSFLAGGHLLARNLDLRQRLRCALHHYRYEQVTFALVGRPRFKLTILVPR